MNCRDVERALIEHEKSGAARLPVRVQEHVLTCNRCSEFMRALNPSVMADTPAPEILRRLEDTLTAGLRPVRPLAPARYFFAAFAVIWKDGLEGMGAALNTAGAMNAYVLSDRGTWISFGNRGDLEIVVEGDKRLFNQYGVMLVNPAKYPSVKQELGQSFVDWLISKEGQAAIANYRIDGQQLFFPDAEKPPS